VASASTRRAGRDARRLFWAEPIEALLNDVRTGRDGLTSAEAAARLQRAGPNTIEIARQHRGAKLLLAQSTSPIMLILIAATVLSAAVGDVTDGATILVIIGASGALGFWQERTAGLALDASSNRSASRWRSVATAA
jgi:P-type Mg2+ transporter